MSDLDNTQDSAAMSPASDGSVCDRITAYLVSGGLFNPEQSIHDRVRDLLIDCRDEIERLRLTDAERAAVATAARIAGAVGEDDIKATLRGLLERIK